MKRGKRLAMAGGVVGMLAGSLGAFAVSASGSPPPSRVRLAQAAGLGPRGAVVGALAADVRMHVTVALRPSDPAGLVRFARAVSDPASPQYHDYLTPAQFGGRFGASAAELRAVEASLRAHGLRPGPVPAGRLSIPVSASAGAVERAFSLRLDRVRLARAIMAYAARRSLSPVSVAHSLCSWWPAALRSRLRRPSR